MVLAYARGMVVVKGNTCYICSNFTTLKIVKEQQTQTVCYITTGAWTVY
jgi:hypothetical protein